MAARTARKGVTTRKPGGPGPGTGATGRGVSGLTPLGHPTGGHVALELLSAPGGLVTTLIRACHRRTRGPGSGPQDLHLEQVPCAAAATEGGAAPAGPLPPLWPQAAVRSRHQAATSGAVAGRGIRGSRLRQHRARCVHECQHEVMQLPHTREDRCHRSQTRLADVYLELSKRSKIQLNKNTDLA